MSSADREVMESLAPVRQDGLIYYVDIVEDYAQLGGVVEFSRNLRRALKDRYGPRLVFARTMALRLGCADAREPYLDRERRAIERLAVLDPAGTILVPNFQSPVGRVPNRPRPTIINVVHDVQFCYLPDLFAAEERRWLHAAFAETRCNADEIVFVSATTRHQYGQHFGLPSRSAVIHPPIRVEAGGAGAPRQAFLLAVQHAGCHPHKNVAGLLRLFAGLAARSPDLRLRIAGQGGDALGPEIAKLPADLRGRVDHLGYVTRRDLDGLYRTARAFVSMSHFEGFNMSAAEAAAHGTPMILSDLPVHRELHADRACLLDPEAPSMEAAEAYLRASNAAALGVAAPRHTCTAADVAARYAGLIDRWDADRRSGHPEPRARACLAVQGQRVAPKLAPRRRLTGALLVGTVAGGAGLMVMEPAQAASTNPADCSIEGTLIPSGGQGGSASMSTSTGGAGGAGCLATGGADGQKASGASGGGGGGSAGGGWGGNAYGAKGGGWGGYYGGPPNGGAGRSATRSGYYGDNNFVGFGGSGGGGGYNGSIIGQTMAASKSYRGGNGGSGGNGFDANDPSSGQGEGGGGGGGGGGGYGAVYSGSSLIIEPADSSGNPAGSIRGGDGGQGGSGYYGNGGGGGNGGVGLYLLPSTEQTVTNNGIIQGGAGGTGGSSSHGTAGTGGAGGIGVVGNGVTIINAGSISGGFGATGTQAPSIFFTGGSNTLTLQSNWSLRGDIALAGMLAFDQTSTVDLKTPITNTNPLGGTLTGSVIQNGTGTLILDAQNTYSGGTTVMKGTLSLGLAGAAGTGPITLSGGVLEFAYGGTLSNPVTVSSPGASGIEVVSNDTVTLTGLTIGSSSIITFGSTDDLGTLVIGGALCSVEGGCQEAITPSSSQIVIGGGTVQAASGSPALGALTAAAASTTINAGTLDFNGNSATIANLLGMGGTLTDSISTTITLQAGNYSGTISGDTGLSVQSKGTVTLSGSNYYTGGTHLVSGTLAIGNSAALGTGVLTMDNTTVLAFSANNLNVTNGIVFTGPVDGDPIFDTGTNNSTISSIISGPGDLTKKGVGSLTLTADNTYSGTTTITAGSLIVDGSIAKSPVTIDAGAMLGGSGTVGGVTVLSGSALQPGSPTSYGTLHVAGDVSFQQGSTFGVKVDNAGHFDSLVADGTTTIANGVTLSINEAAGSYTNVASPYTILTAKTLSGTFSSVVSGNNALPFVDPNVVYGPATVTLTFVRNATPLSGAAATPNQTAVAGAIQTTITAPPTNNSPSTPPVTTVTTPPVSPPTKPVPPVPPSPVPPSPVPPKPTPPAPTQPSLGTAILGQTTAGAQQAFAAAAGTVHASTTAATIQTSRYVAINVLDRLFTITGSGLDARQLLDQLSPNALPAFVNCFAPLPSVQAIVPANLTVWGEGFGSFGSTAGSGNAAGLDHSLGGFVLGADTPLHGFSAPYRVGIAGGYTNDTFSTKGGGSGGTAESIFGSLYGSARYGNVDVRLGASYAANQTTLSRTVAFPGFFESERSSYWGSTVQGFGEVGYRFATSRWVLEPVVDAALVHLHQDQFHEDGGSAALFGFAQDANSASTTLGIRGEAALFNGLPLIARAFLGWRHGYGDINPAATFAFASGSAPFSSSGAPIDHNAVAAEAGLDWRASSRLTLGVSYSGQIGARDMDNSVKGRAEYKF